MKTAQKYLRDVNKRRECIGALLRASSAECRGNRRSPTGGAGMLELTQLGLSCYHSDGYFPPCTRRPQCAWLCMLFCNPLVTWLVSSVKQFVSFMSCFRSFRLRAKAFSRPSILFLEKAVFSKEGETQRMLQLAYHTWWHLPWPS